jgi:hypothetical protein
MAFERIEVRSPETPKLVEPFCDFLQRLRPDPIETPLRIDGRLNEPRVPEHPEMLRHTWLRHAKPPFDLPY